MFSNGRSAHLATITTSSEFNFIFNTMGIRNAWIGGSDAYTEGSFVWITGPEVGQSIPLGGANNWNSGEPNNDGNEDCMMINSIGYYNDDKCTQKSFRCLAEYEGQARSDGSLNSGDGTKPDFASLHV